MKVFVLIGEEYKVEIEGLYEDFKDAERDKKQLEELFPRKWFHIDEHYVQKKGENNGLGWLQ